MPKRDAAYMTARRESILRAVIECISDKGIENTSISSICERAGISPGALYKHFKDKDEIVRAALLYGSSAGLTQPLTWAEFTHDLVSLGHEMGFDKRKALRARLYLYAEGSRPGRSHDLIKPFLLQSIDALTATISNFPDVKLRMSARQTALAVAALVDGMMLIGIAGDLPLPKIGEDIAATLDCFVLPLQGP